ncbi:hypothetical protein BpHYR1_031042 [Brachionus plicatilis]|uniref:Uncharacterized protein n=1 Tax=Brachionus plicatilis TaxID=10195 RepID=A0A3M7R2Y1_BRAPC|nr:hypothetical protein BpHYR1_031042 [Brachionus plicatilis]
MIPSFFDNFHSDFNLSADDLSYKDIFSESELSKTTTDLSDKSQSSEAEDKINDSHTVLN